MVVIMTNIPRRKIYEKMLIFEDAMIEMNIMLYNKDNFKKFSAPFNEEAYQKMKYAYKEIKALLVMFLENKKFTTEEEFEVELEKLAKQEKKVNKIIYENLNFPSGFKWILKRVNYEMKKFKTIPNYFWGKILYKEFDKFNHYIPKLLEMRRDHMK